MRQESLELNDEEVYFAFFGQTKHKKLKANLF